MSAINQNRYDQLLRRVADLQGPGSKVNDVLTELFPMFDVENMPSELLRLSGTKLGQGGGAITSIAAQAPIAQLFNPADSGIIATLTKVYIASTSRTLIRWGPAVVAVGAAIGTELFRDTRDPVPRAPVCNVRQNSQVAFAAGTNQSIVLTDTLLTIEGPDDVMVLAPGTGFEVGTNSLASTIVYSFQWRERVAEPSELNV